MGERPPIAPPLESRLFLERALGDLRDGGWRPAAWAAFWNRSWARSLEQVRAHRRAALEVTALHLLLAPLARGSSLSLAAGWALAITHLGLLGPRDRSLGLPNALTLVRAQLPAARWAPAVALGTDLADGALARRGAETAFGGFADPLADAAFWARLALACEPNPALRWGAVLAWWAPVGAIAVAYAVRGRPVRWPRRQWLRGLSVALQCLVAVRAVKE